MEHAAVIGSPISHSLSPVLHSAGYRAAGLDWQYERIECTAEQLAETINQHGDYRGFSVTMPCKFAAFDFATERTERCTAIGSANTLVRMPGGWLADNTDCLGVLGALKLLGETGQQATLIGAGGTARAVLWALAQRGVRQVAVVNRSDRLDELRSVAPDVDLYLAEAPIEGHTIINTVPAAGLAGREDDLAQGPVFDVIYHPWPTPLVTAARSRGFATVGGHVMLAHQAFAQFESFTGVPAPEDEMMTALEEALHMR